MIFTISGLFLTRLLVGLTALLAAVFAAGVFVGERFAKRWLLRRGGKTCIRPMRFE